MSRCMRTLALLVAPLVVVTACGEDSTDPGIGLDAFIGTYALDPTIVMECSLGDFGDAEVTVDTIEVTDASEDSLYLRLPLHVTTSGIGSLDTSADAEFAIAVTGDDGFGGEAPLSMSVPVGPTSVNGQGTVEVDGEFTDDDTFSADLTASFNTWVGGGAPSACTPVAVDVTGTRVD